MLPGCTLEMVRNLDLENRIEAIVESQERRCLNGGVSVSEDALASIILV